MRLIHLNILIPNFLILSCTTALAQNKISKGIQESKAKVTLKATEKSKTIFGGFLNTNVSYPKRFIGIEATAHSNG
jgi:hypothetical protein